MGDGGKMVAAYVLGIIITYGHAFVHGDTSWAYKPDQTDTRAAHALMVSCVWPLYWSTEIFEATNE